MGSVPNNTNEYGKCGKWMKVLRCWSYESDNSATYLRSLTGGIGWIPRRWDGFAIGVHAGFRERSGIPVIGRHQ